MTRKQLRNLLENFGIDPSFIIVRSEVDRALIRCKDADLKKESKKILKEHKFNFIKGRDGLFDKDTITIEFYLPKKYQTKQKAYSDVLCELEDICHKPAYSTNHICFDD